MLRHLRQPCMTKHKCLGHWKCRHCVRQPIAKKKNPPQPRCLINQIVKPNNLHCSGCGSHKHGIPKTSTRLQVCPAWNQTCKSCNIKGYFSIVCQSKSRNHFTEVRSLQDDEANMDSLIAHLEFDQETGSYISSNKNSVVEIEATQVPFSPRPDSRNPEDIPGNQSTQLKIFPDSGAGLGLGWEGPSSCIAWVSRKVTWSHPRKLFVL